jgi:hypothetical protein
MQLVVVVVVVVVDLAAAAAAHVPFEQPLPRLLIDS